MRRTSGRKSCSWERFLDSRHGMIDSNDTISRMPEAVLHHIISFLPYSDKQDVRFLSRKWRRLDAQNQNALSLTGRYLSELEFSKIMNDDFHLVEFLTLTKCSGIKKPTLVNYKLKTIHFNYCGSLRKLNLNTPFLETFRFRGTSICRPCKIKFGICKELRSMELFGVAMYNMDYNITFPLLQDLTLSGCDMSRCVNMSSNSLKSLNLLRLKNLENITIDAPNLDSFKYYSSTIISRINMNLSKLNLAMIELKPSRYQKRDGDWFSRLINMLKCLKSTKQLVFQTNSDKNIIIPKGLRGTLVPPIDGNLSWIDVKTDSRSSNIVDLADTMLWISPRVKSLYFESSKWDFALELGHQELLLGTHANSCSFCTSYTSRCWRHSVTSYALQHSFDVSRKKLVSYLKENLKNVGRSAVRGKLSYFYFPGFE